MTANHQPAKSRSAGRKNQLLQAHTRLQQQAAASQQPKPQTSTRRYSGITPDEARDLCNALDVLCGCYLGGVESPDVKRLLKDYAYGTKRGKRARRLFNVIPHLIGRIIEQNPDCPRWASQAVDRLDHERDLLADQEDR